LPYLSPPASANTIVILYIHFRRWLEDCFRQKQLLASSHHPDHRNGSGTSNRPMAVPRADAVPGLALSIITDTFTIPITISCT
jgi:hypothetical protein